MPQSSEGLFRVGGMYGAALRNGKVLSEAVEVQATIAINRIEVPLVGTTKTGYKPGRETREGTITIQHIDDTWEMEIYQFLSQGLAARRAARGSGVPLLRPFQLQLEFDDPDALGYELWQLEGCLLWQMDLGFNITDDIVQRQFPLTWESEKPIAHYEQTGNINASTGLPEVSQVSASTPA